MLKAFKKMLGATKGALSITAVIVDVVLVTALIYDVGNCIIEYSGYKDIHH